MKAAIARKKKVRLKKRKFISKKQKSDTNIKLIRKIIQNKNAGATITLSLECTARVFVNLYNCERIYHINFSNQIISRGMCWLPKNEKIGVANPTITST